MKEFPRIIVLAGGQSSRFWPLPHKLTLTFFGKTFLEHQLSQLQKVGFSDIIVVVSKAIAGRISGGLVKTVVQQGEGQGAAILSAAKYLADDPVIVINADDVVSDSLFRKLVQTAEQDNHILVGYKTHSYYPLGYLVLEGKKVARIHEKPGVGNEPSSYIRLVCDYFTQGKQLLSYLNKSKNRQTENYYEETLSNMMAGGETFEMLEYNDLFIPIKYPWHALDLMKHYLELLNKTRIHPSAKIHKSASLSGSIVVEKNVRIMEYAKLVGPLYIGEGTIIGNHTLLRSSMIGANCVVGFGSDITRSFIMDNSWFHSNYVGDCVVADNVGLGAGAILANLRLDEGSVYSSVQGIRTDSLRVKLGALIGEGARIGVGAQLMPGVKIGRNAVVGPGVIMQADLPDSTRCFQQQKLVREVNKISNIRDREKFRKRI